MNRSALAVVFLAVSGCAMATPQPSIHSKPRDCRPTVFKAIELAEKGDTGAIESIHRWLEDDDRCSLSAVLYWLPKKLAFILDSELKKLLRHEDPFIRYMVADKLIVFEDPKYSEFLHQLADNEVQPIRYHTKKHLCLAGEYNYCGVDGDYFLRMCKKGIQSWHGLFIGPSGMWAYQGKQPDVIIEFVCPGSSAEKAGFKTGDIPVSVGSVAVNNPKDFTSAFGRSQDPVRFVLLRNGTELTITMNK